MLSTSDIKFLKSLHNKKHRHLEGKILLEGHRLIQQALLAKSDIKKVWMTDNYNESILGRELAHILQERKILIEKSSEKSIDRVCDSQSSQGVIAVMHIPKYEPMQKIPKYSLYLDDISDPGNLGTLIRTAVWFGIDSIFLSPYCVDPFNSKVLRSGMGAHFYLQRLMIIPPYELFEKCRNFGYAILGADMHGEPLQKIQIDLEKGWILILGSEAHGMKDVLRSYITHKISIPGVGGLESLNVSVAGGILLHNLRPQ
ncbi:MAG: RNA methyltransferase [Candidatus Neomarinimicrobiota bacterium]|nr:RNA methyltransferase [Candidatus Neomarinimicrobiota bacterium]